MSTFLMYVWCIFVCFFPYEFDIYLCISSCLKSLMCIYISIYDVTMCTYALLHVFMLGMYLDVIPHALSV